MAVCLLIFRIHVTTAAQLTSVSVYCCYLRVSVATKISNIGFLYHNIREVVVLRDGSKAEDEIGEREAQ